MATDIRPVSGPSILRSVPASRESEADTLLFDVCCAYVRWEVSHIQARVLAGRLGVELSVAEKMFPDPDRSPDA